MMMNIEMTEKIAYPLRDGTLLMMYRMKKPLAIPVIIISYILVSVKFRAK
jgi:hypothetical protein